MSGESTSVRRQRTRVGGGHLRIALPGLLLPRHQDAGRDHEHRDRAHHEGRERVDLGRDAEPHLGKDHHRQGVGRRAGSEARDHQVIQRQRERQQPPRNDRGRNDRQRDHQEHFRRTRAQIHGRLFQRLVHRRKAGLHHHRDVRHA